jgi:hypothetical protein
VHCRTCSDYDSCADCHVIESVSGTHRAEHDYEVHIYGCTTLVKAGSVLTSRKSENLPTEIIFRTSSTSPNDITCQEVLASEKYWGQLITHTKTPSPIFSRLITAIFAYFDATSTGMLQPSEFCALMFAAGYSAEQFPPSIVSTIETTSPADLHELDAWLTNWFRSFPLDHRMGTREFPPPPPLEPVNGRIRMRDQFRHALMYPPAPVVPDGLPMLSRLGLEQYFTCQMLRDPENLYARLNQLLGALPRLTDPETDRPFETQQVPRACFLPHLEVEEEKRRMIKRQLNEARDEMATGSIQATRDANEAIARAMWAAGGGCWIDSNGAKQYSAGL